MAVDPAHRKTIIHSDVLLHFGIRRFKIHLTMMLSDGKQTASVPTSALKTFGQLMKSASIRFQDAPRPEVERLPLCRPPTLP